jgi:hypothetical protein
MILFDDESTDDFDNMMELYLVAGNRYFKARTSIPIPLEFCNGIFDYPDTSKFSHYSEMRAKAFFRAMKLIQDHTIFKNNSKNKNLLYTFCLS